MKIYTKTGDKGTTALVGGTRVPKYHPKVEAYGTVDELISYVGMIRSYPINPHYAKILLHIQTVLMSCAAHLASDGNPKKLPEIKPVDIEILEVEIDAMEEPLEPLRSFILPGGAPIASFAHIARTICRRAERSALRLSEDEKVNEDVTKYLNRLSDYLFMLARKLQKDEGVKEDLWLPSSE